jgi:hypothetical protein
MGKPIVSPKKIIGGVKKDSAVMVQVRGGKFVMAQ